MQKSIELKKQQGFTLLELLIYMAVLGVVVVYMAQAFANLNRGQGQGQTQSDINANLAFAAEKIDADIRAASAVNTPASAGASSSNLSLTVSGSTVQYCVVSGVLYREPSAGACSSSSTAITSPSVSVATPTFTRIANTNSILSKTYTSVEFTLSISNASQNPDAQFSLTKEITSALR